MSPTSRNRAKGPSLRESLRRRFQSGGANRISNRELRRQAKTSVIAGYRAYMTLLAVLAQKGGDVTVTQGTINQVNANYANLSYVVVPGETEGEFIVRMVEGQAEQAGTQAAPSSDVTITYPAEVPHVAE